MEFDVQGKRLGLSYLTITLGGFLKQEIDAYVEYAHEVRIRNSIQKRWRD